MSAEIIKTLRWVERYLHQEGYDAYLDVGRAADMLERQAAVPEEEVVERPTLLCEKCGADRFKEACKRPLEIMNCPIAGQAADLLERRKG